MKQLVVYERPSDKVCDWHAYRCPHCQRIIDSPYDPQRVSCDCFITPEWHELGHWIEIALAVIWLDKHTWVWLKAKFGLQPKCGCDQRQAALNTFGSRLAACLQNLRKKLTAIFRR